MQGRTEVADEGVTVVVRELRGSEETEKPSGSRMAFVCDGQSLASLKSPYILIEIWIRTFASRPGQNLEG
jgi:hypothetical protein